MDQRDDYADLDRPPSQLPMILGYLAALLLLSILVVLMAVVTWSR